MAPRGRNSLAIIFWVLLVMLATWQSLNALVTKGIGWEATITGLVALGGGLFWAYKAQRRFWPFTMRFCDESAYIQSADTDRIYRKILETPVGPTTVHLDVRTRHPIDLTAFDVRLKRRRFGSRPVDSSIVKIVTANAPEWEEKTKARTGKPEIGVTKTPDEYGGMLVSYDDPMHWVVGQPLWVHVELHAHQRWRGIISFRTETTERRGTTRRRLRFYET